MSEGNRGGASEGRKMEGRRGDYQSGERGEAFHGRKRRRAAGSVRVQTRRMGERVVATLGELRERVPAVGRSGVEGVGGAVSARTKPMSPALTRSVTAGGRTVRERGGNTGRLA